MVVIDTVIPLRARRAGRPGERDRGVAQRPRTVEYPQYTRPRVFRDMAVPEVLLAATTRAVARWRREQSLARSPARIETVDTKKKGRGTS